MNCPLLVIANCSLEDPYSHSTECTRENCAWWDGNRCVIISIAHAKNEIKNAILTKK